MTTTDRPFVAYQHEVRAIPAGRQTQFRRVVKTRHDWYMGDDDGKPWPYFHDYVYAACEPVPVACPFGQPGTRLWVRETWLELDRDHWWDSSKPRDFVYTTKNPRRNACAYRAETDSEGESIRKEYGYKWRPSIRMPRWASRLTLEVENVRVERVQEISEEDILAEGVTVDRVAEWCKVPWSDMPTLHHAWQVLWDSINGPDSWRANPWVFAVNFRVVGE